jgi:hypothetical protein
MCLRDSATRAELQNITQLIQINFVHRI